MQRTLIALACTLAVAAGSALAQDRSTTATDHPSAADTAGQKARHAAHRTGDAVRHAGDKTRNAMHRGEHKMSKARSEHDHDRKTAQEAGDDTRAMGASDLSADSERQKRMDEAYNNYKSGRGSESLTR